jgi:feruloyl esterase
MGGAPIFRRARRTADVRLPFLLVADWRGDLASMELVKENVATPGMIELSRRDAHSYNAAATLTWRVRAAICYHRFLRRGVASVRSGSHLAAHAAVLNSHLLAELSGDPLPWEFSAIVRTWRMRRGTTDNKVKQTAQRKGVMSRHWNLWFAWAASVLLPCAVQAASGCADLLKFSAPGVSITAAKDVAAGPVAVSAGGPPISLQAPARCSVDGIIGAHTGADGKSYGIRFEIAMPKHWNGRLLYQGGGGLNGSVQPPVGAVASGDTPALARGFAVVTSDSGHEGAVFDSTFLRDQQAALDFLYQSIGKVMAVARPLVAKHYGNSASHTYFVGCSTGGREAMISAQRYPSEFDGIVAGAPAMRTNYSNLATRWVTVSLNAAAPKDAQGHSLTAQALSDSDRKLVVNGLLKSCDALDGVKDGMVFDTRHCGFDPKELECKGAKGDDCLSAIQVQAIEHAFAGPKTASGTRVYPGFPYDTGIAFKGLGIPGLLSGGLSPVGPSPTGTEMNVEAEAAVAHDAREMAGDSTAWTNLSSFTAHAGKLIFYHGMSDPWFSALDTVDYYERLAGENGPGPVSDWSRLFLVPGMGHCGGGEASLDRFDMLSAIVEWVEQGHPPEKVVATGAAFAGRSRPLCAYPRHAQYGGSGNTESAASFHCEE